MSPVRIAVDAEQELRAAIEWYEGQHRGLGRKFLSEVDRVVALIRTQPSSGQVVPRAASDNRVRRFPLRRFPYFIVYRETGGALEIVAVAHSSRKPGYWRRRPAR